MKRVISALMLVMFATSLVACHASVDTDPNGPNSSHYKKTTTVDDNGNKTTKTETRTY